MKPRIVVTCDPELDDLNTLIRFLLYSTDFRVEGLVYASSQFHWKGDGKGTKRFVPGREYTRFGLHMGPMESWRWAKDERFINDAVDAYEKVYPNLRVHNPDYPSPGYLKSRIRYGNIEFDGDISKDSPGSDLIKSLILDNIPGPLFITAQGGASTIARALKSIQDSCVNKKGWDELKDKISKKVILSMSGDQDDTYANYIKPNWPGIEVLSPVEGGLQLGYNAQAGVRREDAFYYTPGWIERNISCRGPLGELYRVWGDGKQMVKGDIFDFFGLSGYTEEELRKMGYIVWMHPREKGSFLGEGDTYTYLNLLDNGLRAYEDQNYGGWAGRIRSSSASVDFSALSTDSAAMTEYMRQLSASDYPDFLPAVQNGMAARLKWSVTPVYVDANHEPVIKGPFRISAKPGEKVELRTEVTDPDGNEVTVSWIQFRTNSYQGEVHAEDPASATTFITVPEDAKPGQTIHMILQAVDEGTPALTHYHRVNVTII
ncbi:MAG TPA: nucleoside hydrolase-like domain-containing protein [Bacteroidales bacterium]|nr:nucleoside hydrolase-like domain-containing protein [Bacteroidales bacterium]